MIYLFYVNIVLKLKLSLKINCLTKAYMFFHSTFFVYNRLIQRKKSLYLTLHVKKVILNYCVI